MNYHILCAYYDTFTLNLYRKAKRLSFTAQFMESNSSLFFAFCLMIVLTGINLFAKKINKIKIPKKSLVQKCIKRIDFFQNAKNSNIWAIFSRYDFWKKLSTKKSIFTLIFHILCLILALRIQCKPIKWLIACVWTWYLKVLFF